MDRATHAGGPATVRRPQRPNTALVRVVLDRLAGAGQAWAPRFLGVEGGDEVLSWLEGSTAPDSPWPTGHLDQLTLMVRRLHEVTAGLVAGAECVVHDDLQPRNVVLDVAALTDRSDVVDTAIAKIARCIADIERCARAGSARHLALQSRGDDRELRTWHDRLVVRADELTDALR